MQPPTAYDAWKLRAAIFTILSRHPADMSEMLATRLLGKFAMNRTRVPFAWNGRTLWHPTEEHTLTVHGLSALYTFMWNNGEWGLARLTKGVCPMDQFIEL